MVPRFINLEGKWKDLLELNCQRFGFDLKYLLQLNFKSERDFPPIQHFPEFYKIVILSYNRSKLIIPFDRLKIFDLVNQPL